ncbi:MAG: hypothetical protein HYY17_17265 [Planctomycetes bacterium]|nr:hypothetical protein [Planctomycetota bacterium]
MRFALGVALLTAGLSFFLLPWPAAADVLPSRPGAPRRTEKERIAADIERRGVSKGESAAQVRAMSARDLDYFAAAPGRVQLAAGMPVEDIIIGGVLLAVATGIAIGVAVQGSRP